MSCPAASPIEVSYRFFDTLLDIARRRQLTHVAHELASAPAAMKRLERLAKKRRKAHDPEGG